MGGAREGEGRGKPLHERMKVVVISIVISEGKTGIDLK